MAPDRGLENKKYQQLFKVKRCIIEATNRAGDENVVGKLSHNTFATSGSNRVEICYVPIAGEITWSDAM